MSLGAGPDWGGGDVVELDGAVLVVGGSELDAAIDVDELEPADDVGICVSDEETIDDAGVDGTNSDELELEETSLLVVEVEYTLPLDEAEPLKPEHVLPRVAVSLKPSVVPEPI